mgnify:CR=1 FL=1
MSEKRGKSQGSDSGREFYTDEFLQPSGKSPSQKYQVVQETGLDGNVHLLGTDMHHINQRTPDIKKAVSWLSRNCTRSRLYWMVWKNPAYIIKKKKEWQVEGDGKNRYEENDEIDLLELFYELKKKLWLIILAAIIGGGHLDCTAR